MVQSGLGDCLLHSFPFNSQDVNKGGTWALFERLKGGSESGDVVTIDRADIRKAKLLKKGSGTDEIFERLFDFASLFG